MQGLEITLMELLMKYKPPNPDQAASSRQLLHKQIVPIGLSGLQPLELLSRLLHAILECIKAKKDWMHFQLHVVPVCVEQLVAYANFCMESYNHKKVPVKNLPDLRPYFRMFGEFACYPEHVSQHYFDAYVKPFVIFSISLGSAKMLVNKQGIA